MTKVGSKSTSGKGSLVLAVLYLLAMAFFEFLNWFDGKPRQSVQDVIGISTFFVLWGIGAMLLGIDDLCKRIGPPRE